MRGGGSHKIPVTSAPVIFPTNIPCEERISAIQNYINSLQYNYTGTQFFEIRKKRPITGLMDIARDIVKECLPIKCLEAVILALFLTSQMPNLERFPISFKSVFNGCTHRHVVLGLYLNGLYGAMGLSRRKDLMDKPVQYKSLSSLCNDYCTSYKKYHHVVKKLKIGLPVTHDVHSYEKISWKALDINLEKANMEETNRDLDKFLREARTLTTSVYESRIPVCTSPKKHMNSLNSKRNSSSPTRLKSLPSYNGTKRICERSTSEKNLDASEYIERARSAFDAEKKSIATKSKSDSIVFNNMNNYEFQLRI